VQVVGFLAALHHSNLGGPTLIACPATVLRHWANEFAKWSPVHSTVIFHPSEMQQHNENVEAITQSVFDDPTQVLITTYEQLRKHQELFTKRKWQYVILDEGHRIRNPDAAVTLACKRFRTFHRLVLTGAPIQNKLTELWSIFDFVFPGKLGTLPVFQSQFEIPIAAGGFANATELQVHAAYKCACVLRDLITPYLLRRQKKDVALHLPQKNEQVLFCKLSAEQRFVYTQFLTTVEMDRIQDGSLKVFGALTSLRKICNHPHLFSEKVGLEDKDEEYGDWKLSGKMIVLETVLKTWKAQDHRCLVFSQTQQMLDIIEQFAQKMDYAYFRMDGDTPVKQRQALIDNFNTNRKIFLFLLTTKVGGIGVNLIGANRVLLFDPDWNPSTDIQARERAWRIGQERDVTVYRLITRGTIEEKVYHRQIFKHFLTNKILNDPKQRRFFKMKNLKELFELAPDDAGPTETGELFSDISAEVMSLPAAEGSSSLHGSAVGSDAAGTLSDDENPASASVSKDDNAKLLRLLLDGEAGVASAMCHESIVNAPAYHEHSILEMHASTVAKQAAEALRQSRMSVFPWARSSLTYPIFLMRDSPISCERWTGSYGSA
jgi:DNA excision repair protein ERCC-6